MLRQAENKVRIEGILSEINIDDKTFKKNGADTKAIGGSIKILVKQVINGEPTDLEVPVYLFATALTKTGATNPAYDSIRKIRDEMVSIAAGGIDAADRVRITNGSIQMNEYYSNGKLISFPRISASFINKINKADCKPEATFVVTFVVGSKVEDVDKDGVSTGSYTINAILPQYGGKVDVIPFKATAPGVVNAISTYWNLKDTVRASGRLNFSSRVETVEVPVDFGEPQVQNRTISVSELIITGGSQTPLDGELAFEESDIEQALRERTARLAEQKDKAENKGASGKAPAKNTGFSSFGF